MGTFGLSSKGKKGKKKTPKNLKIGKGAKVKAKGCEFC